jgi:hypothetical protein
LAPTNTDNATAMDDRLYLTAFYEAGAATAFDVLGVHAYGFGLPPDTPQDGGWNEGLQGLVLARVVEQRAIMTANGDGAKPVWVTEMGWTVAAEAHSAWHAVSEAEQATYLVRALAKGAEEWPWVTLMTVWNIDSGAASPWRGYSILDEDAAPRPAYTALREYLTPSAAQRRRPPGASQSTPIQILAADTAIHLGDAELPAPWRPLHRNRNPSTVWEGTFYLPDGLAPADAAEDAAWLLTMRTMQSNYWGNQLWINDMPLATPLAISDFTKSWVTQRLAVPAHLLQPGANRIRVTIAHAVPLIQDRRFGYDKLQFSAMVLHPPLPDEAGYKSALQRSFR